MIYANEIVAYKDDEKEAERHKMLYETDILVYERNKRKENYIPRVVIETKINSITTHDAITYSQKSASHKYVHPYLRYGIFLGNQGRRPLPGRLFRHGINFDFMVSWKKFSPGGEEWKTLLTILRKEIRASKKLGHMIFHSKGAAKKKYFALHKPLITYLEKQED